MSNRILQIMLLSTALTAPVVATSGGKDEDISNWLDRTSLSSGSSIPTIGDIGEDYETGSIASMGMTEVQSVAGGLGPASVGEKLQDLAAIRKFMRRGMLAITPKSYQPIEQATMLYATAAGKYDKGIWIKDWGAIKDLDPLEDLLLRFTQIRTFKAEYSGQDLEGFAGVLEKSVQFYEALEELDLTGCGLGKGIEEIIASLGKPDNLKVLKVKGNKLGSDNITALRKHLSSLTVLEVEGEVSRAVPPINEGKLESGDTSSLRGHASNLPDTGEELSSSSINNEGKLLELYQGVRNGNKPAGDELISLAESGDELAQSYLAICYQRGGAVAKDADKAQHWAKKSINWLQVRAEEGLAAAQANLGEMYVEGLAVDQDYGKAVELYRKAADQGDASAQTNLGWCYQNGKGVEKDFKEAVKWYREAVDQGNARAQFRLGLCYARGNGVKKDPTEAVKWYREAADQGNAEAQSSLGWCYTHGNGVEMDHAEAVKWYRRATDQGHTNAQNNLGWCYQNGNGVNKDSTEAVKLYRMAANQGNASGQNNLGWCYNDGEGVKKDPTEAVKWYRKAAGQGHAAAQYNLGVCYKKGEGVGKNIYMAMKLYKKAARQGQVGAQKELTRLGGSW